MVSFKEVDLFQSIKRYDNHIEIRIASYTNKKKKANMLLNDKFNIACFWFEQIWSIINFFQLTGSSLFSYNVIS